MLDLVQSPVREITPTKLSEITTVVTIYLPTKSSMYVSLFLVI